jgi:hypothetical protein
VSTKPRLSKCAGAALDPKIVVVSTKY